MKKGKLSRTQKKISRALSVGIFLLSLGFFCAFAISIRIVNTHKMDVLAKTSNQIVRNTIISQMIDSMSHMKQVADLSIPEKKWKVISRLARQEFPEMKAFIVFSSSGSIVRQFPENINSHWIRTLARQVPSLNDQHELPVDVSHIAPITRFTTLSGESFLLTTILNPIEAFKRMTESFSNKEIYFSVWDPAGRLVQSHPYPLSSYELDESLVISGVPFRLATTFFPNIRRSMTIIYPSVIIITGLLLSILVGYLSWIFQKQSIAKHEKMQFLLDHTDRGVIIVNQNCDVADSNRLAKKWFRFQKGKDLRALIKQQFVVVNGDNSAFDNQCPRGELILKKKQKQASSEQYLKLTYVELSSDPNRQGDRIYFLEDVTEIIKKGRVNYDMMTHFGHKLRTPLTSIFSGINLMRDKILGPLKDEQVSALNLISADLNRIKSDLNQQTLYYSVLHQPEILRGCDNFRSSIQTALSNWQLAKETTRKISVVMAPYKSDWSHPTLSYQNLEIILHQLLENSYKHVSAGDLNIRVSSKWSKNTIHLTYQDNGPGIPKIYLDKVFDPFFQFDPEQTGQVQGLGLGLAIVKNLVTQSNGTVSAKSTEKGLVIDCIWKL